MFDFVSKFSPTEKIIFYITVFVVSLALGDRLLLGPAMDRIADIKQEIKSVKVNMQQDQQVLAFEDRIIRESQSYAKYIPKQHRDDDEINTELFRTIEQLARKSEVELIKSNPSEVKDESGYVEYHANLDVAGSLEHVIGFMHALNSSDDLFKVVRFDMSPRRGTEGDVETALSIVKLIIKPDQT